MAVPPSPYWRNNRDEDEQPNGHLWGTYGRYFSSGAGHVATQHVGVANRQFLRAEGYIVESADFVTVVVNGWRQTGAHRPEPKTDMRR